MVRLTREQLYALVWDKPMRTLAGEFGLSDVALHKICRKHDIPTPPVGYWAKKAHGKRVSVTPLPTAASSPLVAISSSNVRSLPLCGPTCGRATTCRSL